MPSDSDFAPQGSPEWHAERLGHVTASESEVLMKTPKTKAGKARGWTDGAQSYLLTLLGELLTGLPVIPRENDAMRWGHDQEPEAVKVYQEWTGRKVQMAGFMKHQTERLIGGSPDGLVDDDGGLEIKCPWTTRVHLEYLLGGDLPKEHVAQVQSLMWITGRQWWDFMSFDPRIPAGASGWLFFVHVERDEDYISELSTRVLAFRDALDAAHKQLAEMNP